ncbi:MAG: hypothetical protein QOG48_898 [Verrucomicrobiota bacterium]|jgi:peptidoglycan hydrolase-like protein with peptidoglycan-binding domain
MRSRVLLACGFIALAQTLYADELTRCVQEELRRRNLYFGDVDGRMNSELQGALRRYQGRKSLGVTGEISEETAQSLNVPVAVTKTVAHWPDVPVLKSDVARELAAAERSKLEQTSAQELSAAEISPAAPAESPSGVQNISPEQITKLVERYLRDAEGDDVDLQVGYYGFPVEYFDHGAVDRGFVTRDTKAYLKRWPDRHYQLTEPVSFRAGAAGDELQIEFTISFTVRNAKATAEGRTRNFWTLRPEKNGTNLQIVRIREQRLHI